MAAPAERMRAMRARQKARDVRELRITAPDARLGAVKARIARQSASLDPASERDALAWIEAVSTFDAVDAPGSDAAR